MNGSSLLLIVVNISPGTSVIYPKDSIFFNFMGFGVLVLKGSHYLEYHPALWFLMEVIKNGLTRFSANKQKSEI